MAVWRITPACAGKTVSVHAFQVRRADPPRMRGEDPAAPLLMTVAEGSPPHARGRHMVAIVHYANRRITPACAGKTWRCWVLGWRPWDHPRMRGEDFFASSAKS